MAGIFGSGDVWMPPQQQQQGAQNGVLGGAPMPNWASKLGIIGATLADAGANFSGRPADAVNLQNQMQMQRQQTVQRALQSTPFSGDAQSYLQALVQAGVPVETALQAASGQRGLQGYRTLTADEKKAAGYKPDSVVQVGPDGQARTAQASDLISEPAVQQQLGIKTQEGVIASKAPLTQYQRAEIGNTQAANREKQREFDASNPMGAAGGGGLNFDSAPVATKNTVRAMLEGRMAPPTGMALRTPYWQNMMALANTVDPTFDQTMWAGRYGTRKDVEGGGKTYQMMNSGNTAIQHLGRLNDQIPTVSGIQLPLIGNLVNRGVNAAELGSGNVGVNTYNDTLGHVSEETTKFYRMTGGNEADIQRTMENLSPNLSTAQKKDGVANTVHLIFGALQPKVEQYNKIMGTDYPVSHFLSSKSVQTMKKMGFDPDTGEVLPANTQKRGSGNGVPDPSALPQKGGKIRTYNPATGKLE